MNLEHSELFQFIQFILQFAVVPLIMILWRLNNSLSELKLLMYREFVTKGEMEERFRQHRENRHAYDS
jgi:hypothetical protein